MSPVQVYRVRPFQCSGGAVTMHSMPAKRPPRKLRPVKPELRTDVTRLEYLTLRDDVTRNAEAIRRLEHAHRIQFTRTAELQAELDALKKGR
jgi:hypothetical protein